jgi:hypothetical protein
VLSTVDFNTPIFFTETLGSKSDTEQEITCAVSAVGGNVTVAGICCYEQDRPFLNEDATDLGVNVQSCAAQQPIILQANASLPGAVNRVGSGTDLDGRRAGLFHMTWGSAGTTRITNTYQDMLVLPMPVLAGKLYRSDVLGAVTWSVYAEVDGGSGDVRLTAASGQTSTLTVTATSPAWVTSDTLDVDCEDMASVDGRQTAASPAWDTLQVAFRGNGTNTLTVYSVSVWEDW